MSLLAVPKVGFVQRSVMAHRSDRIVVSDWVEGSALFFNRAISRMEVRDFLCDFNYYENQGFAMEFVEQQIWPELRRRTQWLAKAPVFKLDKDKIAPLTTWDGLLGTPSV